MAGFTTCHADIHGEPMSAVIKEALLGFRPMVEEDLTQIMAIENSAYTFPWNLAIFQDCLRMGYSSWVLERDCNVISYGVMTIAVGECHILNICVCPDDQGNGFGKMMLDHLLEVAQRHNADMAFLEVRPSNDVAKQLYQKNGFDEVGMRRNYYPAHCGREDAVIMARSLV